MGCFRFPALLLTAIAVSAAADPVRLGLDYATHLPSVVPGPLISPAIATDRAGSLYLLNNDIGGVPVRATSGFGNDTSYILKLGGPDRRTIYRTVLDFRAFLLAVDASGNVYLAGPGVLAKLNATGTGFVYRMSLPESLEVAGLAIDGEGYAYITGRTPGGTLPVTQGAFQKTAAADGRLKGFVARVNTSGTAFVYATYLAGSDWDTPLGIVVDPTGSAFVTGVNMSRDFPLTTAPPTDPIYQFGFLTRLAPNGARVMYSTVVGTPGDETAGVAVDAAGNAVVRTTLDFGKPVLLRFDPQGSPGNPLGSVPSLAGNTIGPVSKSLTVDSEGNVWVAGYSALANYPVKDSVGSCGLLVLTGFSPAGEVIQSTWIPNYPPADGGLFAPRTALAVSPDGQTIYVAAASQSAPGTPLFIARFSTAATPRERVQLACAGNAASLVHTGGVSPGELISLFGDGIGPPTAIGASLTASDNFPLRLGDVQITFDDMPAPLIWAQDGQINTIAPWSLAGLRSTRICVLRNGIRAGCVTRRVAEASPAVFMQDQNYAAALNEDGSVNSAARPARRGSMVSVFATGLGPVTPGQSDGTITREPLPVHVLPASVYYYSGGVIGSSAVRVEPAYAGPAPALASGVSQINFPALSASLHIGVWAGGQLVMSNAFLIHVADEQ